MHTQSTRPQNIDSIPADYSGKPDLITLITNPKTPVLTDEVVNKICKSLKTDGINRLAENIACDIKIRQGHEIKSADLTGLLQGELEHQPIDIVIQNTQTRRKKALIAGMDSTMIEQECFDELVAMAGIKNRWR